MLNSDIIKFANTKVLDESGRELLLGQLWKQHTIMFVFLRHFACIVCRAHAKQIWEQRQMYERTGARIVFVGNGAPNFIQAFKEDLKLQGAVILTDPTLEAFRAVGFKKGFLSVVSPTSAVNIAKRMIQDGVVPALPAGAGNLWQLGGILVITKAGQIAYKYVSEAVGDYAPKKDVVQNLAQHGSVA